MAWFRIENFMIRHKEWTAILMVVFAFMDNITSYLLLGGFIDPGPFQVSEANPIGAWQLEHFGLVNWLAINSLIVSLSAAGIARTSYKEKVDRVQRLLMPIAVFVILSRSTAAVNNFLVIAKLLGVD